MYKLNNIKKRIKMPMMPTIKEEEEIPKPFTYDDVLNYRADEIQTLDKLIVYGGKQHKVLTDISYRDEFIILSNDNNYEWLVKTSSIKSVIGQMVSILYV
jgi:hypothetical protein